MKWKKEGLELIVRYKIEKHKEGYYVVWCESKTKHGYGIKGIYQGTKKECQEYLEKLKGE